MVGADFARMACILPLLAVHQHSNLWIVYAVAFAEGTVSYFTGPFGNAAIPNVVGKDRLQQANSIFQTGAYVAALVGPILGGIVLSWTGLTGIVIADSASYLLSGFLVSRLRSDLESDRRTVARPDGLSVIRSTWHDWMEGVRLVIRLNWLVAVFAVTLVSWLGSCFGIVAIVPFVRHTLGGSAQVYGWTMAAQGLGGITGGLVFGRFPSRSPTTRMVVCLLIAGAVITATAVLQTIPATLVGSLLLGAAFLPVSVGASALIQGHVPDQFRGRVFGTYLMLGALVAVVGSLASGVLTGLYGPPPVLAIAGALMIAGAVLGWLTLIPATRQFRDLPAAT
jgi:MFS family permease